MSKPRLQPPAPPHEGLRRRTLLRRGLVLGGAVAGGAAAADSLPASGNSDTAPAFDPATQPPGTRTPGRPFSPYGQPAEAERYTARRIAAHRVVAGNGVSWTPLEDLEGVVTPSGLHFERHHNGVPAIDPAQHRLLLHGRVRQPLRFGVAELLRYPMTSRLLFIECGGNSNAGWHAQPMQRPAGSLHGMVSCSEWTGVSLGLLLDEAGAADDAGWLIAEGADAVSMNLSLPVAGLRAAGAFVALFQNGERLRPEQGYPMRLVVPGWEGVTHVKWLQRLQLTDRPVMARNETAKYTELQPDGRARGFTFTMDVKSLITRPTHGQLLPGPGFVELSGLAWSGHGRISRVEVSTDGGTRWRDAALQGPVLPQCLTRFRAPWTWDGRPAVLQSRATDETGRLQPTRAALVAERGTNGYFHYHAIVSWAVDEDGAVSHVYA